MIGDASTPLTRLNFSDDMKLEVGTHLRATLEVLKAQGAELAPTRWLIYIIEEAPSGASL